MKYIHFFFCLLLGMVGQSQIKIGDNPQTIDPSSVLELESSSRVLVITRVNTAQMNAITPSAGAMVYNTDIACIHYYTGVEWKNICDAVAGSITFTSDDGTVVITSTGDNNYDIMVGQIKGDNIIDATILGTKLWPGSITRDKLAPDSVGEEHLRTGSVTNDNLKPDIITSLEIINSTIKPEDMEAGGPDQLLTTDAAGNVVWLDKTELGSVQADQLTIIGAGTATDRLKVRDGAITTLQLADNSVTSIKIADNAVGTPQLANNSVTSAQILDGQVQTNDIADDGVTTDKILNANVTPDKLANGTGAGQLMQWNGTDWVLVADTALSVTEVDGIVGNEITDVTNTTLARSGTGTNVDPYTLGIANLGVDTDQLANGAVTNIKIADDNVTLDKIANGTAAGQLMQWNGTDWVLVADTALSITEADGIIGNEITDATNTTLIRSGTGTNVDPYTLGIAPLGVDTGQIADGAVTNIKIADDNVTLDKIANGTAAGQLMQWNGTDWVLVADTALSITEADGIIGNEVTGVTDATLIRSGTGIDTDPYTLGINNLGVGTGQLADDAVTNIKIADDNVTLDKLANGTVPGQLMQWNGIDWELVTNLTITGTLGVTGRTTINEGPQSTSLPIDRGSAGQVLTTDGTGAASWVTPAVVAMGKVDATATTVNTMGAMVVQDNIGVYTVTLNNSIPDSDYIVQLTLQNASANSFIQVTTQGANSFSVEILNEVNVPQNSDWFFTVTNF